MNKSIYNTTIAGWIAGFWDGEGSISIRKETNGKKHTTYYLSVGNTDLELMECCVQYLEALGIEHTEFEQRVRHGRKQFFIVHICKAEAIKRFAELIPIKSQDKVNKLKKIVEWIDRPKFIQRFAFEHESKLRELYPNHTIRCIVTKLGFKQGCHHKVTQALKVLGIWSPRFHQGLACNCRRET